MPGRVRCWILACALTLSGCAALTGSTPTTFYLLSSLAPREDSARSSQGVAIGVGPVEIPAHLNRPQIVTRSQDNRLGIGDFHNWGEPLRESLSRVLAENLSVLLETERVITYPWPRSAPIDYRLRVEVTRFAAGPDPSVHLRCRWVLAEASGKPLLTRVSRLDEATDLDDYDAIVAAMSRSVEALSREMAAAVRAADR